MSMRHVPSHRRVVVGVDTHKYVHVAVAIDELGAVLDRRSFAADAGGYGQLIDGGESFGGKLTFGIEGTGSYGAGLAGAVRSRGIGAIEVMRTDRRDRHLRGKSDTIDAENAARAVLAGLATAVPKSAGGVVGDDSPDQGRERRRRQGANIRDDQPETSPRERSRRAAVAHEDGAHSPMRGATTGESDNDHSVDEAHATVDLENGGKRWMPRSPNMRRSSVN